MKRRVTYENITAGQSRPYADSIYRERVTFESQGIAGYKDPNAPFSPDPRYVGADKHPNVRTVLRGLPVGFTDDEPRDWASTRLEYLREISPGVWEFQTRSPYTD